MGFLIPTGDFTVELNGEYTGAEIVLKGNVPLKTFLEFSPKDESQIGETFIAFGDSVLVSWNLEDDEGEIPPTGEGMLRLPASLASEIMVQWNEATVNPQVSSTESSDSSTSVEDQPAMAL
tara:strand:+ start:271 stop:633 length:363 start_codon:yes stop_codon:yes gene_type:complete